MATVVAELDELIAFTSGAAAARPRIAAMAGGVRDAAPGAPRGAHRRRRRGRRTRPRPWIGAGRWIGRSPDREGQAQRRLAEWAIAAQSGQLARLLASMSAAIAQQLASSGGGSRMTRDDPGRRAADHARGRARRRLRVRRPGGPHLRVRRAAAVRRPVGGRTPPTGSRATSCARCCTTLGETPGGGGAGVRAARHRCGTPAQVPRAARGDRGACATTYAWLVANAVGDQRRWAVNALTDAAVRELTFRGSPEIFPGAGEYADR